MEPTDDKELSAPQADGGTGTTAIVSGQHSATEDGSATKLETTVSMLGVADQLVK